MAANMFYFCICRSNLSLQWINLCIICRFRLAHFLFNWSISRSCKIGSIKDYLKINFIGWFCNTLSLCTVWVWEPFGCIMAWSAALLSCNFHSYLLIHNLLVFGIFFASQYRSQFSHFFKCIVTFNFPNYVHWAEIRKHNGMLSFSIYN